MIILWFSYGLGVFPFTILIRFWLRFQYGYAGKHGSESSSAASPKTYQKPSKDIKTSLGGGWRRIETKSYQNRNEIVSKSNQHRIKIVSKSYPNRIHSVNHINIVTGRIIEIISKSYRHRKNNYSRKWLFAKTLNVTSLNAFSKP